MVVRCLEQDTWCTATILLLGDKGEERSMHTWNLLSPKISSQLLEPAGASDPEGAAAVLPASCLFRVCLFLRRRPCLTAW